MAGLYVHVPFCAQACSYCDFHFTTRLQDRDRMVQALLLETAEALDQWRGEQFKTLYFGGGTPSVLGADNIMRIADVAFRHADWELKEWTVEANPEDLDPATLKALHAGGVTRLSVGIQSFEQDVLEWMRRIHGVERAESAVQDAMDCGFQHVSLDLMYGLPVGLPGRWERDLAKACALPVDHLSCYILTAEPRTLYGNQLSTGKLAPPPDGQVLEEYGLLCAVSRSAGFEHYEVSNLCRPGGRSCHNSAYWNGTHYLGVGPGAHSFRNQARWWNNRSNAGYLKAADDGRFESQRSSETLSVSDRFNEALITGLRRIEGVDTEELKLATGLEVHDLSELPGLIEAGDCEWIGKQLRIPEHRWPMGDAITSQLMV